MTPELFPILIAHFLSPIHTDRLSTGRFRHFTRNPRLCFVAHHFVAATGSLASFAATEPPPARAVVAALSERTPAARKASVRRQLAALCPTPLSDDELEWAAQFVEGTRSKGAAWVTGRLLKMHREP